MSDRTVWHLEVEYENGNLARHAHPRTSLWEEIQGVLEVSRKVPTNIHLHVDVAYADTDVYALPKANGLSWQVAREFMRKHGSQLRGCKLLGRKPEVGFGQKPLRERLGIGPRDVLFHVSSVRQLADLYIQLLRHLETRTEFNPWRPSQLDCTAINPDPGNDPVLEHTHRGYGAVILAD